MIHLNIKTIFLLSKDEIPIAYYFSALDSKNSQNYDYYYLTIDENPTISKAKRTGFFQKKPDIQEDMTFKIG